MGFCGRGPLVQIEPDNILYEEVTPDQAESIIEALQNKTEADLLKGDPRPSIF
jgi:bidirectional [NiFe] hydrogenase diaphorase subunit